MQFRQIVLDTPLQKLVKEREKADILWESEVNDGDDDESSAQYQAYQVYKECDKLLSGFMATTSFENSSLYTEQVGNLPIIIQLYFTAKTVADACFDFGDYLDSYRLSLLAKQILDHCKKNVEIKKWIANNPHILGQGIQIVCDNLESNAALSLLFHIQVSEKPSEQNQTLQTEITNSFNIFINQFETLRENKKTSSHELKSLIENILNARIFFSDSLISFTNPRHMDYLRWCVQYVFTTKQIINLIKLPINLENSDFFTLLDYPDLDISTEQKKQINELVVAGSENEKNLNNVTGYAIWLSQILKDFKTTEAFAKLNLKKHQVKAYDLVADHLSKGQTKAGLIMATGTGKTWLFGAIIMAVYSTLPKDLYKKNKTLVMVPYLSLGDQTKKRIDDMAKLIELDIKVSEFNGKEKSEGDVTVISFQSLLSEMGKSPHEQILDIDNYKIGHHDEIHESLTENGSALYSVLKLVMFGYTATGFYNTRRPKGSLRKVGDLLGNENCIYEYTLEEGIKDEVLAKMRICTVEGLTTSISRNRGRKKNKNIDYNKKEIDDELALDNYEEVNATVVELYKTQTHPDTGEPIEKFPTFSYCVSIAQAKKQAQLFQEHGIKAEVISGELPMKIQRELLAKFSRGEIKVLCNVKILITGIDLFVVVGIFTDPTKSIVRALQRLGRFTRSSPDKLCALIFEIIIKQDQLLATQLIGGKYSCGNLKELDPAQAFRSREQIDQSKRIEGACDWKLSWDKPVQALEQKPVMRLIKQPYSADSSSHGAMNKSSSTPTSNKSYSSSGRNHYDQGYSAPYYPSSNNSNGSDQYFSFRPGNAEQMAQPMQVSATFVPYYDYENNFAYNPNDLSQSSMGSFSAAGSSSSGLPARSSHYSYGQSSEFSNGVTFYPKFSKGSSGKNAQGQQQFSDLPRVSQHSSGLFGSSSTTTTPTENNSKKREYQIDLPTTNKKLRVHPPQEKIEINREGSLTFHHYSYHQ